MELRNDKGQSVRLLRPLTRPGGEGQVFEIENAPAMVAKVYHQPAEPQKVTRLRYQVQVAKPDLRNIAAWPTELLLDPRNPSVVRGIVMPRMAGKEIHKLYGPGDRAAEFPAVGWDFLIHVAMNCGAAFETLHEQGVVMADVNEGNLLVKEGDGQVGLIDCDSYQIGNGSGYFLCDVGVPMWTPPELQGQDFRGMKRTPNHDRFGLAVIIFRLLFMGRHPFAGIPTGRDQFEIEDAIKRGLFAFSPQTWGRGVKPPPLALPLGAVPERLRQLFERAFLQGSAAVGARPTGREWALELKALLAALKKACIDPGHKFWNGLTSCPWCQIVTEGGPNFFISVSIYTGTDNLSGDFTSFWATIERVAHGTLMNEKVALPTVGTLAPRAMPLSKPQIPSLSAPIAPSKPLPLVKPTVVAPMLPVMPVMAPPARLIAMPLGQSENAARVCALGAVFFGLAAILSFNLDLSANALAAGIGTMTCLIVVFVKARQARVETRRRIKAQRTWRAEERRVAAEEHEQRLSEYEAKVEELTQKHVMAVAQAEALHRREWDRQDHEYRTAYNDFLAKQRVYDDSQKKFSEAMDAWNTEVNVRTSNEDRARRALNGAVKQLQILLNGYRIQVAKEVPVLESAKKRIEKAKSDELADMRVLHQKRQELQLRQFLGTQRIQNSDIPNIGSSRKATLSAYNIYSAADVHPGMKVTGFGYSLIGNLMAWRRSCEARFRYDPNAQLPIAEINAVKIKHAQTKQSALAELRGGAAKLDSLENKTGASASKLKTEILTLTRAHAQAIADRAACS